MKNILMIIILGLVLILTFMSIPKQPKYQDEFEVLGKDASSVIVNIQFEHNNIDAINFYIKDIVRREIIKYGYDYIINNHKSICYDIEWEIIDTLEIDNIVSPILIYIKSVNNDTIR